MVINREKGYYNTYLMAFSAFHSFSLNPSYVQVWTSSRNQSRNWPGGLDWSELWSHPAVLQSDEHKTGWCLTYPSEKYESQLGWLFPICGKIKNVRNHQPENQLAKWSTENSKTSLGLSLHTIHDQVFSWDQKILWLKAKHCSYRCSTKKTSLKAIHISSFSVLFGQSR